VTSKAREVVIVDAWHVGLLFCARLIARERPISPDAGEVNLIRFRLTLETQRHPHHAPLAHLAAA
jgi:hypothetical protein